VARSTDDGATWTAPAALNANASTDRGDDEDPQVATDGLGTLVAVWDSNDSLGDTIGWDWDILVARSTDDGVTWTAPAALNTNAASDAGQDAWPQVTSDGQEQGAWVAVWESMDSLGDTIGEDTDILVARSTDDGATWTAPAALNTNAASDVEDDSRPQLTTDEQGTWIATWQSQDSLGDTIGTDFDVLVARSTDDGVTWTAPAALNTNAASDVEDDNRPQVTTDGRGTWVAVWHSEDSLGDTIGTDRDILVARSTDDGVTWTAPAALNTNAASEWWDDAWPQVTTDEQGTWVAVWRSPNSLGGTIGTDDDILVARSTDDGVTWTAPAALNTNAGGDAADDTIPQLTTDGEGAWVAVWEYEDQP
jgi:Neuraminidase (sialidase)